ncbi:hypothetical protein Salat_2747300 [Sesamum alatum]|uniref:Uncharacterized protein n=1 Tax=Sesamum alatum TaxID=300844 RepID=A0AAE1XK29_9LAMI|nr:hypothetical protein Salat_2747300 [Sesamum alatum]
MEVLDEDESMLHKEVEDEECQQQGMATEEDDCSNFHILVNAITGVHNFNTMRVTGCCKGKAINILIDTGSTHNFVDFQVARRLGCKLDATDPFPVAVTNGSRVYSTHTCKSFNWRMQGVDFVAEMMTLPLGGCDVVLGVQRLVTLGNINWNFRELKMEFHMNGRNISLKGKQPAAAKLVDIKGLRRILQKSGQMVPCCFHYKDRQQKEQGRLDTLLTEYADLFEEPKALPPRRGHDHGIIL